MSKVLRWFLCCICLAVLAACSDLAMRPAASSSPMPTKAAGSAAIKAQPQSRNSAKIAAVSLPTKPAAAPDPELPDRLIGLDGTQLRDLLGQPSEERDQAPAKLWRFRYASCTLEVALYPDVQTQTFRSLNYEVTGDDGSDTGKRRCAAQLQSWANRK